MSIERYKKSVDVLFQAYFDDTLRHGDCGACAVGNLCREAGKRTGISRGVWTNLFYTSTSGIQYRNSWKRYPEHAKDDIFTTSVNLIAATGYTVDELARVEFAFETAPKGNSMKDWMYNGLVAVLDVLKDIHGIEEEQAIADHQKFNNHYQLVLG